MLRYMCKRLLRSFVTLFIIIVIIFSLLRLMPEEGYFDNYDKLTPTQIENKLTLMGLRDPQERCNHRNFGPENDRLSEIRPLGSCVKPADGYGAWHLDVPKKRRRLG